MKKLAFLLLVLLTSFSALAGPKIYFPTKDHDFGNIHESNEPVSYDFVFTNKGDAPLIILKAVASCGCTTPLYTKEPIAPGASSTIKVSYSTAGRPSTFHKTITIYSNDPDAPNVVLIIQGFVIPIGEKPETSYPRNMDGFRLKRTNVPMLETRIGSIKTEVIDVINNTDKPMAIGFHKVPKHVQVHISNTVLKPDQVGAITIKYIAALAADYGKRDDSFYVVINNKEKQNPNNKINLTANITEDFSRLSADLINKAPVAAFSQNRIELGSMVRGTSKTSSVNLTNNGKTNLLIRKIVSDYDGMKVNPAFMSIAPGKTIKLNVTFNAGTFDGNVVQRFTVITNDPKASINRIFVHAVVTGK